MPVTFTGSQAICTAFWIGTRLRPVGLPAVFGLFGSRGFNGYRSEQHNIKVLKIKPVIFLVFIDIAIDKYLNK